MLFSESSSDDCAVSSDLCFFLVFWHDFSFPYMRQKGRRGLEQEDFSSLRIRLSQSLLPWRIGFCYGVYVGIFYNDYSSPTLPQPRGAFYEILVWFLEVKLTKIQAPSLTAAPWNFFYYLFIFSLQQLIKVLFKCTYQFMPSTVSVPVSLPWMCFSGCT